MLTIRRFCAGTPSKSQVTPATAEVGRQEKPIIEEILG